MPARGVGANFDPLQADAKVVFLWPQAQ